MTACPVCSVELVAGDPGQLECPKCRGVWIARDALGQLLRGAAPHADPPLTADSITVTELPPHLAAKHQRACPACSVIMKSGTLFAVLVDLCADDHGVWVDAGELSRIVLGARRHDRG